jgi:hypothetical protein
MRPNHASTQSLVYSLRRKPRPTDARQPRYLLKLPDSRRYRSLWFRAIQSAAAKRGAQPHLSGRAPCSLPMCFASANSR